MTAGVGVTTSGGSPNALVEIQPGMWVQPVVLVDQNGQYITAPSSVMTTLGDTIYENATPAPARLAGNTTGTKKFLTQTGTGVVSAAPAWGTIASGDLPASPALTGTPTTPTGTPGDASTQIATDAFVAHAVAAASQCGQAMLNLGWLGATCNFLQAQITGPGATVWAAGTTYLFRIDAVPGAAANGFVSFSWLHHAGMANCYIGLYNSSGTRLGVTADLSSTGTGEQRVACTGFTAVPADGILYAAYLNGTSGVAGGPYQIQNVPYAWTTALTQPGGSAPYYSSDLSGSATALPSSLTLSSFTTVYALTAAIAAD